MSVDLFRARTAAATAEATERAATSRGLLSRERLRLTPWTIGSALLRARGLHYHYWIDEGLSVGIASHPLSQIPHLMRQDGSPPLYYLLLHVWMAWRGHSEVATHELSLIFALLTIPVAYWAGASLFGRRVGLVCALIAAGLPYLTTYGTETRMYAMLALLALIAAASFAHTFVLRHRRYLPLFVVSLAAVLYTHNWAAFFAAMTAVAFLWCVRNSPWERRALWRDGALAFGGVAILYAPWIPMLVYQAGHTAAPWDLPPVVWSLSQGLYSIVGGRGAAVALLLGGGAGLLALIKTTQRGSRVRLAAECLFVLGIGTLLLAWLYSKITPAWAFRYLAVVAAPLLVLFALGIVRGGRLGLVALALCVGFWILDPAHSIDWKSNVASVAATMRPQLRPDALVIATQPEQIPTLAYYLPRVRNFATPLGRVRDPRVMDWRSALARLRRARVRSTLMPMVDSLSRGQQVLLVVPVQFQKSPLWLKLIAHDSKSWSLALSGDPSLRQVATAMPHAYSSGLGVRGTLYVVK
jgi:hypothetical protein